MSDTESVTLSIDIEELPVIKALTNVASVAAELVQDVLTRHPGEELRCPYMKKLADTILELQVHFPDAESENLTANRE